MGKQFSFNDQTKEAEFYCSQGVLVLTLGNATLEYANVISKALEDMEDRGFMRGIDASKNALMQRGIDARKEYDKKFPKKHDT